MLWVSNEVKFRWSEEFLTLNLVISNLWFSEEKKKEYLAINRVIQIKNLLDLHGQYTF